MKCSIICSISKCGKWCLPNRRNNCNDDILVLSMARLVAEGVESWDVFGVQQRIIDLTYYIIKEGIGMPDCCLDRIFVGWEMVKDETKYACVMLPPYDTGLNTIRFEMGKIVWLGGLDILYIFRIYPKTGELMDLR